MMKRVSQWFKNTDGTVAIEFALVSIPFFMMMVAIIELSIVFASASLLEGATGSAARLVRTGEIYQSGNDPKDAFKTALCNFATNLINCNDIEVEAIPMQSFGDYKSMQPQYDEDGAFEPQGFDAGGSNDRILIRAAYNYNFMTPFVGYVLSGGDNKLAFMSTVVLQTEPYEVEF